jgi:hypothetical protein
MPMPVILDIKLKNGGVEEEITRDLAKNTS